MVIIENDLSGLQGALDEANRQAEMDAAAAAAQKEVEATKKVAGLFAGKDRKVTESILSIDPLRWQCSIQTPASLNQTLPTAGCQRIHEKNGREAQSPEENQASNDERGGKTNPNPNRTVAHC